MDQGRIVEEGTYRDLLGQAGLYARLYKMPLREAQAGVLAG